MGRPLKIIVCAGQAYNRWTVISGPFPGSIWEVLCTCGTVRKVNSWKLVAGHSKSCGCLKVQLSLDRATKHGMHGSAEYLIWSALRDRCNNPRNKAYANYGGRGITVSPSWDSYATFIADMGQRPHPKLSLDRIDNDGPYSPGNCRWATREQQASNTRKNTWMEHEGVSHTASQWARFLGFSPSHVSDLRRRLGPKAAIQRLFTTRKIFQPQEETA